MFVPQVVKAKAGHGSATLSMAFAGARFACSLIKALNGEQVIECAYVDSCVIKDLTFFSTPLLLGKNGIEKNLGLPPLNDFEKSLVQAACADLQKEIAKGIEFAKK